MQMITNLYNHFLCLLKRFQIIHVNITTIQNIHTTNHKLPIRYVFDLSGSYHFRIIIPKVTAYSENSYNKQKPDTFVVQLSVKLRR